jgi:hypothetical protein
MQHSAVRFGIAALATWRVTHLLAQEDGPADVVLRARAAAGDSPLGELMDCFACTSLWVAAALVPVASRGTRGERVACWLGLSGAACLLQRLGGEDSIEEDGDGLLRKGSSGVAEHARAAGEGTGPAAAAACAAEGGAAHGPAAGAEAGDAGGADAQGDAAGRPSDRAPHAAGERTQRACAAARTGSLRPVT